MADTLPDQDLHLEDAHLVHSPYDKILTVSQVSQAPLAVKHREEEEHMTALFCYFFCIQ